MTKLYFLNDMRPYTRKSQNKYRRTLSDREASVLSELSFNGKIIFSPHDLQVYVDNPRSLIDGLIRKKWILKLAKEVYLIVPFEAGKLGAANYTIHSFVVASVLVKPYYIGYWSAFNYYGFSDQTPPAIYLATQKPRNSCRILDTQFRFVTINPKKFFGIDEVEIEGRKVKISSPEKTLVDCLDHPEHCEGVQEVAKALYFGKGEIDSYKIVTLSKRIGNNAVIKRLGYIAEQLDLREIMQHLSGVELSEGYSLLDPTLPRKGRIKEKWKIVANIEIDQGKWVS